MQQIGPPIESLNRRLLDTPPEFLVAPHIGSSGHVHVAALVNDLLTRLGHQASESVLSRFTSRDAKADGNRLQLVAMLCWLMSDEWFASVTLQLPALLTVLDGSAEELAKSSPAARFQTDPDRREELARVVLARLDRRPEGETVAQATDRLASLSVVERRRLLEASRAAEARARAIREALAKKAAEESADKWSRE